MSIAVALLLTTAAATPVPPVPPVQPVQQSTVAAIGPPTVQQSFDAASTLDDASDYKGALAAYRALEARLVASGKNLNSLALVRLRIGIVFLSLQQFDDAATSLRTGLAALPADNANFAEDRRRAQIRLAQLLERQLDYGGAAQLYSAAQTGTPSKVDMVMIDSGVARTMLFSAPDAALRHVDSALANSDPQDKPLVASMLTLRGRVLMNMKRFPEAKADLLKSMNMLGGLTRRVDYRDLQARSDLAIASMLNGNLDDARKYLAYTGAGHFDVSLTGADMEPPTCGGTPNIAPDDMAIVDFSISADGTVAAAQTIYASNPASALAFAQAARGWSWTPDKLAKIPALFRASTRVELRCTKSISTLDVGRLLDAPVAAWMSQKGLKPFEPGARSYAAWIDPARAELLARRKVSGSDGLEQLPVLFALLANPIASGLELNDALSTVDRVSKSNKAPPAVIGAIALANLSYGPLTINDYAKWRRQRLTILDTALSDPFLANDPPTASVLLLAKADISRSLKEDVTARQALDRIIGFVGIANNDPVKVAALVRIASINAASGNMEAAREAFLKTGLSESQCALADAKPVQTGGTISDSDFPAEAMQWGFSGFAVTEFDIDSGGKPIGIRTTVAYPPLIFGPATNKGAARFRYQQSFRPNGALGCTGNRQRVSYRAYPGN
jgi:tetratricopeptide (TPR) repeat protein